VLPNQEAVIQDRMATIVVNLDAIRSAWGDGGVHHVNQDVISVHNPVDPNQALTHHHVLQVRRLVAIDVVKLARFVRMVVV